MKSKVASSSMLRARSLRNKHAPLSTPTSTTDSPAKSFDICRPSSATRAAISSRLIITFNLGAARLEVIAVIESSQEKKEKAFLARPQRQTSLCVQSRLMKVDLRGVKITWLGHATFKVETPAGKTILIDPWVMNNPKCPDAHKRFEMIDVMLCTHGHGDHIGDGVKLAKKHNPVAVGVYEICLLLEKKSGPQKSPMNKRGRQKKRDIRLNMGFADHPRGSEDAGQIGYFW